MGLCGSKSRSKSEEKKRASQRLEEFFGSTVEVDVKDVSLVDAPARAAEPAVGTRTARAVGAAHPPGAYLGQGLAPIGTNARLSNGALSESETMHHRGEIEAAAKLIESMGNPDDPDIQATADKDGCHYELSINWATPFVACATQRIFAMPMTMLEVCALIREPDLIPLPHWPGLPRIEKITVVHEWTPSNHVYHMSIEPWGPFPGVDSIACCVAYVRPDGAVVGFARSPPESDAAVHRGWSVLPPQRRRKRMQLEGCAWVITPRADGRTDCTIYMKTRIPIPSWLVPPPLVRWVTPKVFRRIMPLLASEKVKEPFRQRVREDRRGFYHVLKQQLRLEESTPATPAAAAVAASAAAAAAAACTEKYSLGVHKAPAPEELKAAEEAAAFAHAIKAYDWKLAEKLAASPRQKKDLEDSIARVNAIELHTNRGERDKALALAITPEEVNKIQSFRSGPAYGSHASTPRGFFDSPKASPRPSPRVITAKSGTMVGPAASAA